MPKEVKTITVHELKKMMDEKQDFQLIDVREKNEYDFCTIGGELIPMGEIINNIQKISKEKKVIMYCHTGGRSSRVAAVLQAQYGFTNLYNLEGGIFAWSEEIDPNVPQY